MANQGLAQICAHCKTDFTGRKKKYCCKECYPNRTFDTKRFRKRGALSQAERNKLRYEQALKYVCKNCGVKFKVGGGGKSPLFCSKNCQKETYINESQKYNIVYLVWFKVCCVCNNNFTSKRFDKHTCSTKCLTKLNIQQKKIDNFIHQECTCKECGVKYTTHIKHKQTTYCSKVCSLKALRRIRRHKERARLRLVKVESVDPIVVFNRDNWKCQLCGIKTPERLKGLHKPNSPELDHIIPLSKGGEHSYRNTQCSCRQCNCNKSNKIFGQQLLFG